MARFSAIGNSKEQLLDPYRTRGSKTSTSALNRCFDTAEVFERMFRLLAFASNKSHNGEGSPAEKLGLKGRNIRKALEAPEQGQIAI